jgi:hypothetical protein
LPEVQRQELFQHRMFLQLGKDNLADYATMVRDTMPAAEAGNILADAASSLRGQKGDSSYGRVDEFIANTGASEQEKNAIVNEVIVDQILRQGKAITTDEIDKARDWGARHAPEAADKATGDALARSLWTDGRYEETTRLVMKYHAASGTDAALAAFLKHPSVMRRNTGAARALIGELRDPALREQILALPQYQASEEP